MTAPSELTVGLARERQADLLRAAQRHRTLVAVRGLRRGTERRPALWRAPGPALAALAARRRAIRVSTGAAEKALCHE